MMDVASRLGFLNNEAVEGDLLADKLSAGALPPEAALQYALQVGRTLAAAHARGMVHGCLSPDCVLIATDGAHLLTPGEAAGDAAARYRAPEQVRGEAADWRSDIFSYGVLLYEMASGKPAFSGQGAELDDAILNHHPAALMAHSPIHLAMEGVIAGCLEKEPAKRRQRIRNALIELKLARTQAAFALASRRNRPPAGEAPGSASPNTSPPHAPAFPASGRARTSAGKGYRVAARQTPAGGWRRRLLVIGLATLALAATGVAAVLFLNQRPPAPVVKFSVPAPEHTSYPGTPSVSPDGQSLTFSAVGSDGSRMLWLRALDESHSQVIAGTEGGFAPFWSPDSEWIAFFANRELKRVHIKNGPPQPIVETITEVDAEPGGGAWNREGVILFAPAMNDGLYKVMANGGKVIPVLKPARFEHAYLWPQFLPDGKHFIFFNQSGLGESSGVYVGGLEPAASRKLFAAETNAVYSPMAGAHSSRTGYLLYMKDRDLMGQEFDAGSLEISGAPRILANDIGSIRTLSLAPISVSANAVLVYQTVGSPARQLLWMDRSGKQTGIVGDGANWGPPRVSPDGSRIAVGKMGADGKPAVWIFDARGMATRFTEAPKAGEGFPTWSPDGARIAFWSDPEGVYDLYVRPVNGIKAELVYKDGNPKYPTEWSHDGKFLLFDEVRPGTDRDVMAVSMADKRVAPILNTVRNEGYAALSPDGKWLAYQSDDSGRIEVYVQPFEGLGNGTKRRWKISPDTENGQSGLPRWRGDGQELFYITSDGAIMSANVHVLKGEFGFDTPKVLFQTRPTPKTWNLFDVSPDGQRFLVNLPQELSSSSVITVMTSWTEKLKS